MTKENRWRLTDELRCVQSPELNSYIEVLLSHVYRQNIDTICVLQEAITMTKIKVFESDLEYLIKVQRMIDRFVNGEIGTWKISPGECVGTEVVNVNSTI